MSHESDPGSTALRIVAVFMTGLVTFGGSCWVFLAGSTTQRLLNLGWAAGMAFGVLVGLVVSRRERWLGFAPLVAFSVAGYLFSFRFSQSRPLESGDYTAAATVLLAGVFAGLLGTVTFLITVALRATVTSFLRRRGRAGSPG
jgi:hypothetical protein